MIASSRSNPAGKKLILDLIGVSLAGYGSMEFPRLAVHYLESSGEPLKPPFSDQEEIPSNQRRLCQCFVQPRHRHGLTVIDSGRSIPEPSSSQPPLARPSYVEQVQRT